MLKGFAPLHSTKIATRRLAAGVIAGGVALLLGGPTALASGVTEPVGESVAPFLAGRVISQKAPLERVRVYAIETADEQWSRTETDAQGRFLLESLAPGLYKLIAFKVGYVPAVLLLTRGEADEPQFVEIELGELEEQPADDFWSARGQIPTDVLRDLELALAEVDDAIHGSVQNEIRALRTQVQAYAGSDDRVTGGAITGGSVAVDGQLGDTRVAMSGDFREFGSPHDQVGSSQSVSVSVESRASDVEVTSVRHDFEAQRSPMAFEHHAVDWSRDFGRAGRSQVRAEFTKQHGFYGAGGLGLIAPDASRAFEFKAEHTAQLTDAHHLTAGVNYRETMEIPEALALGLEPAQRVELYSDGGFRIQPRVLVQYGLITTLQDGVLSFVPRGGAVVRLNDRWTASTLAAQRVYTDDTDVFGFRPVLADNYQGCQSGQESCYQVEFARQISDDRRFAIGASHRTFDETLQLFFDEDLLNRLDTIYLVDGDELPELTLSYTTRVAPGVLSRLQSHLAIGGGGQVVTATRAAENQVQYLVTSLDTHFERSDTGVYVAFQKLQQSAQGRQLSALDLDKLQLRLTQELNSLVDIADLAVSLNYELARGTHPNEPDLEVDELRQRLTGGVALSF